MGIWRSKEGICSPRGSRESFRGRMVAMKAVAIVGLVSYGSPG